MRTVVIDANLGIARIISLPYTPMVINHFDVWEQERARLIVPTLWWYEITSVLRLAEVQGLLSREEAYSALEQMALIDLEEFSPTIGTNRQSLVWAGKLGQPKAYDAQYLTLAEQLEAEFWTADRKLANSAQQAGAAWVHWIGEGP